MNFSLLNPYYLIGLLAVLFPIIAHFISRKAGTKKKFSTVSFLLSSQANLAKSSKIKDLILLIIRALILVLIVTIFSKPSLYYLSNKVNSDSKTIAYIIDNSFSMGYENNLKKAKTLAGQLIDTLGEGSFAAVFPLVPTDDKSSKIAFSKKELKKDLSNVELSNSYVYNRKRIDEVFRFMKRSPNSKIEVFLISDFQKNGWLNESFRSQWFKPYAISSNSEVGNTSITDINVTDLSKSIKIEIKINNFSNYPRENLLITVHLCKQAIKGFIDIKPNDLVIKTFILSKDLITDDTLTGRVEISHDNLRVDDTRYFVLDKNSKNTILVVDGDPREIARFSETFYITKALETLIDLRNINLTIKDNNSFLNENLGNYNMIFLANVGDLTISKSKELEDFIKNGGLLFIFLGDRTRANIYNNILKSFLPASIGTIVEGNLTLTINNLNIINFVKNEQFSEVSVNRLYKLQPNENSQVILNTSNESPFLLNKNLGTGTVYLFASSADISWNDFALSPVFIPTINTIIEYFLSKKSNNTDYLIGDKIEIDFPLNSKEQTVIDPSSSEHKVANASPEFSETTYPGIYQVKSNENSNYFFSVNIDPKESNLEKLSFESDYHYTDSDDTMVKVFKEVWLYFAWALAALFISEAVYKTVKGR